MKVIVNQPTPSLANPEVFTLAPQISNALVAFILPTKQGTPIYTPLRFLSRQGQLDECS